MKKTTKTRLSVKTARQIFLWPAFIFVVSFTGLIVALLFDGPVDIISAIAAGIGLMALLRIRTG